MNTKITNSVNGIPSGNYDGYYWMSDAPKPEIIDGDVPGFLRSLDRAANPFVIESQLFDRVNHLSYSIKYIDGDYHVYSYEVKETIKDVADGKYDNITLKKFCANRIEGVQRLLFFQYWKDEPDPLCENMPVLQPIQLVFVGFEKNNEK